MSSVPKSLKVRISIFGCTCADAQVLFMKDLKSFCEFMFLAKRIRL